MLVSKLHGCGNDFCFAMYEDGISYSELATKICDRHIGMGADGLILVKTNPSLEMVYYNADGSRAPMCGNGIRCFALYCYLKKIVTKDEFDVLTLAGVMKIKITSYEPFKVVVNMGKAYFDKALLHTPIDEIINYELVVQNTKVTISSVFLGTVHTVIFVNSFEDKVLELAKDIHESEFFKEKTNVNFVKVNSKDGIEVKTYERGCGWTLACGTGCCASVYLANKLGLVSKDVKVILRYGQLNISLKEDVYMEGPAKLVYESEWK